MSSERTSLGDGANGSTYSGGESPPEGDHPLLEPTAHPASGSVEELEEKYAPYVRIDACGTMGRGELPFTEKLLLGIALVTLVPIRVAVGVVILIVYYLICRICTLFSDPNLEDEQEDYAHMVGWRRGVVVRCGRFLSRVMLFLFGFYWIHDYYRILNTEVHHVSLLLCQFVYHIEVIHLLVYYPSEQEKEDPKLYASNVQNFMATEGKMILSDIGLAEKRIYHAVLNGNSLPCLLHEEDD